MDENIQNKNAKKQADYRARMRDKDYILVRAWIPKKYHEKAKNYLANLAKKV